jgi:multiple sugar transport system substrate-binding protein
VARFFRRIVLAGILVLCAGCGHRGGPEPIVIRISNWGGAGDDTEFDKLVQDFYRQFERENPGVVVRQESNPENYVQKMMLNFVAGTEPDVMTVDASSAALFVNNGVLMDLTPLIKKDKSFHLADYFPNVLSIGQRGNKIYTIPGDFTPMAMYYNKRLFDAAGVPYPKAGWNFGQFRATAAALTKPEIGQYGFVFSNWMPGWVMWLWNNGAEPLSPDGMTASGYIDSPKAIETLGYLRDLVVKDKVAPSFSQVASTGVDLFADGKVAMTISGHWSLVSYKAAKKIDWRQLGVVELPHQTPESHTVMYEAGFGITQRSKHKELAWKLVKMWTSYRLQSKYNASGIAVCARKDVAAERATEPIDRQFVQIINQARPPAGSWIEGYDVVEDEGRKAMDTILNNPDTPVGAALKKAAERIDHEFEKRR